MCLELALLLREDVVFKSSLEEINLDEFALIIQELDSDITREQGFDSEDIKVEKKLEGLINALKPKYLQNLIAKGFGFSCENVSNAQDIFKIVQETQVLLILGLFTFLDEKVASGHAIVLHQVQKDTNFLKLTIENHWYGDCVKRNVVMSLDEGQILLGGVSFSLKYLYTAPR